MKKLEKNIIETNENALKDNHLIKLGLKHIPYGIDKFGEDNFDAIRLICSIRKNPNLDYSKILNGNDIRDNFSIMVNFEEIKRYPIDAKNELDLDNNRYNTYKYPKDFYDSYDYNAGRYFKPTPKISQLVDYEKTLYQKLGYKNIFNASEKLSNCFNEEKKQSMYNGYECITGPRSLIDTAALVTQIYCPDKNVDTAMLINHIKNNVHTWDDVLSGLIELEKYDPKMFRNHMLTKNFTKEIQEKHARDEAIQFDAWMRAEERAYGDWD